MLFLLLHVGDDACISVFSFLFVPFSLVFGVSLFVEDLFIFVIVLDDVSLVFIVLLLAKKLNGEAFVEVVVLKPVNVPNALLVVS